MLKKSISLNFIAEFLTKYINFAGINYISTT